MGEQRSGIVELQAPETECDLTEEKQNKLLHDLGERVKELNCLYEVSKLVGDPNNSLDDIFQGTVDLIPFSWQYPEVTCARIKVFGKEFKTGNFRKSKWKQSSDIIIGSKTCGSIDVFYLGQMPMHDEGAFLSEERNLIDDLSRQLGLIIEREKAEKALHQYEDIVSSSKDMLALLDKNFIYLAANDAYLDAFGIDRGKMLNHSVSEIFGEKFFKQVIKPHADKCLKGEDVCYEDWFDFPVTGKKYMQINYYPHTNNNKIGFVVNGRDITERKKVEAELRESKSKLESIFDSSPNSIAVTDLEGKIVDCNQATLDIHGYSSKDEVFGKNAFMFIAEKDHQIATENMKKTLEQGVMKNVEYTLCKKDGGEFAGELSVSVIKDISGIPAGFVAITRDVTGRKEAKDFLKEKQEELETITDSVRAIIFYKDRKGRFIRVNKTLANSTSIPKEKWIGKTVFDLFPEMAEAYAKDDEEVMASEKAKLGIVEPMESPEGTKTVLTDKIPVKGEKGKVIGLIGLTMDITALKKAEEKLKQKSEQQEVLLSSIPAFVYYKDTDSKLVAANKAFSKMVNVPMDQLFGKTAYDLFPKEQAKHFHTDDKKIMDSGRSAMDIEEKFTDAEGETRWASTSKIPYFDAKGQVTGMVGITTDITRQKRTEREIKRAKDYLQNIIDSASGPMIAFNENFRATTWNKTVEYITGYERKQIIGKHINKLDVFDNPQELLDSITNLYNGHKPLTNEIVLNTKEGSKKIIKPSYSVIKSGSEKPAGVLISGIDITSDMKHHRKILRGNSYLIPDRNNKSAITLFVGLTRFDYDGLFITRSNSEMIKSMIPSAKIQVELLSQDKLGGFGNIKDLEELKSKIKDFCSKHKDSVILLDRVDYLTANFSFDQFIKTLYQINNIISTNNSILLLHLNPSILDSRQVALIEDEMNCLPSQKIENIQINDDLFNILKFIYEQNNHNTLVSFSKISKQFSTVRETTRKRLLALNEKDLIFITKHGRAKTLHVSEKGEALLNNRKIV